MRFVDLNGILSLLVFAACIIHSVAAPTPSHDMMQLVPGEAGPCHDGELMMMKTIEPTGLYALESTTFESHDGSISIKEFWGKDAEYINGVFIRSYWKLKKLMINITTVIKSYSPFRDESGGGLVTSFSSQCQTDHLIRYAKSQLPLL